MNVIGIIAEYNPFHKGHAYQIEKIKREVQADYAIIAMSGDFVQRGAPALVDKYCRAQMALSSGADLVLELPVLFASSSAEYFAKGGVSLLCHTGVVTHLGFGTENGQLSVFQKIAGVLLKEPELYANMLNVHLKNGFSFPNARAKALQAYFASTGDVSFPPVWETLSLPNNILAIEYLKALAQLGSSIIPYPIKRQGNGYHDISREGSFCSAAAIRAFAKGCRPQHGYPSLEGGLPPSEEKHAFLPLADAMPQAAFEALCSYPRPFLFEDSFSTLLQYKLLTEPPKLLSAYADSSPALANRIKKMAPFFVSWSNFCKILKTKNVTYTHLSRLLLHILLNIYQEDYPAFPEPLYLRALGFRKDAAPLLSAIKSHGTLPLLVNLPKDSRDLDAAAQKLLSYDINASNLYNLAQSSLMPKDARCLPLKNDYRQPILCL